MMKCLCSKCEKPFEYKGKKDRCTCPHCGNEDYVEINFKLFETRKARLLTMAKNEFESLMNYKKAKLFYENILLIDDGCCFSLMRYLLSKLLLSDDKNCNIKEATNELEKRSETIYLDEGTIGYLNDALMDMRKYIKYYINELYKNVSNEDEKSFLINAVKEAIEFTDEYINIYNGIGDLSQFLNEPIDSIKDDISYYENKINKIEVNKKSNYNNYALMMHNLCIKRLAMLLTVAISIVIMVVGFIMLLSNISLVIPASILAGSGILLFVIFYSLASRFKKKIDNLKVI